MDTEGWKSELAPSNNTLNDDPEVEPGWVDIQPLNWATDHDLTWLLAHTRQRQHYSHNKMSDVA